VCNSAHMSRESSDSPVDFCPYSIERILISIFFLTFICFATRLQAQVGMATLSGAVTDPSGLAIPNAQVTLQNLTENATRETVTNAGGQYVIPAIPPGTYRLIVKANGFQSQTLTRISLTSGQGSTLNATLKIAQATAEVTVNEAPPLLESTTATLGSVVDSHQFTELPQLGRNFTTLLNILPGVSPVPGADASYAGSGVGNQAIVPSVYGQRQRDNDFTLDGAVNVTPNFSRLGMIPPPEAISEMKVSAGMDSGAFGWASGANINIVTKSGSNEFHGDVWEFFRNSDLNARSHFIPRVGAFHWNQFGASGGGPLVIPKVLSRNKAWYVYGWYEGVRVRQAANNTTLLPTPAQLNGDFLGGPTIYNPFTTVTGANGNIASRQPFPGNRIPADLLNPTALALAKTLYPLPNSTGIPGVNFINTTSNANTSDQWSGRVDHQFSVKNNFYARYSDWRNETGSSTLPTLPVTNRQRYTNVVATETHVFDPTFLVTARFTMMRFAETTATGGPDVAQSTGLVNVFPPFRGRDFLPPFSIAGYASLSQSANVRMPEYYLVPTVDFQKTKGRHSLAFGAGFTRTSFMTDQTHGGENFSSAQTAFGAGTGDAMASFLLGLPFSANRIGGPTEWTFRFHSYSWYVQDTFRANAKWTFNIGLRWDYISPMDVTPGLGTFDYNTGKYYFDHTNPITHESPNLRSGGTEPDYRGYQPRVGIAYQLTPKTVVRASFGIFNDIFGANQQSPTGTSGNWPYSFPQTLASVNAAVPDTFLQNPFPGPPVGSVTPLACAQCQNIEKSSTRNPYVEEWSLSLQRQITQSLLIEADYFGSHGVKLLGQVLDNVAAVPGTTPLAQRVRWPGFAPYVNNGFNEYMSWYHGLDLKLEKRFSRNLSFLVSYTFSKTLDQSDSLGNGNIYGQPTANPTRYNISLFKGPAGFDIRHRLSASYNYDIPGHTGNKWLDAAIAHWQLSGIVTVDSGVPFYPYLTTDNENIGIASFGSPRYTEFPNLVCDPTQGFHQTASAWFNTSCYQLPAFGTRGGAGRHAVYSQGLRNWDAAINKQWPLGESKVRSLQFRAEFFNALNATTFDPPGVFFGTAGFGKVSSTVRQPGRQIQFALKLHF